MNKTPKNNPEEGWERHRVVAVKRPPPACVNCKSTGDAGGVVDMYGRFWCVSCLVEVLGDLQPGRGY